jgi:hypothetical protein
LQIGKYSSKLAPNAGLANLFLNKAKDADDNKKADSKEKSSPNKST